MSTPTVTATTEAADRLDRRREQATAAAEALTKAKAGVTDLDNRLQTNSTVTTQQKQALRNAEAEVWFERSELASDALEQSENPGDVDVIEVIELEDDSVADVSDETANETADETEGDSGTDD